jgi:hypothetical protein
MVRPRKSPKIRLQFDAVESDLLAQLKAIHPEYANLDLGQIARMELRYKLFADLRRYKADPEAFKEEMRLYGFNPLKELMITSSPEAVRQDYLNCSSATA